MPFPCRSNSLLVNSFGKSMIESYAILSIRQLLTLFLFPLDHSSTHPSRSQQFALQSSAGSNWLVSPSLLEYNNELTYRNSSLRCSRPTHSSKPFVYTRFRASATQATKFGSWTNRERISAPPFATQKWFYWIISNTSSLLKRNYFMKRCSFWPDDRTSLAFSR